MDYERINEYARMQLRFVDRVEEGREYLMTRTFSGVKLNATDEKIHDVAVILSDLQLKPLKGVFRVSGAEIVAA